MPYAERTTVLVENTKVETEGTLTRCGADHTQDRAGIGV